MRGVKTMNCLKNSMIFVMVLAILASTKLQADDLAKTCQDFKTTFLEACKLIDDESFSEEMKFLRNHLNYGGTIVFFDILVAAIDDCIEALAKISNNSQKSLINSLKTFKAQINSDESYDINTGTAYKRETLRSGKTRVTKAPYNANRCYKIHIENPEVA